MDKDLKRRLQKAETAQSSHANDKHIRYIYRLCEVYNIIYPDKYQVDHIVPLGKEGIHNESNLQIVTASDNKKKGVKLDSTVSGTRWLDIQANRGYYDGLMRILYS